MPIDRTKLIKLLGMTQSTNDGEALNAIRLANAMLAANKLTWELAIKGVSFQPTPPKRQPSKPSGRGTTDTAPNYPRPQSKFTDPDIPRMLSSLMRDSKGNFLDFVESINDHWCNKGYLTEKQYEAITNAYERAK